MAGVLDLRDRTLVVQEGNQATIRQRRPIGGRVLLAGGAATARVKASRAGHTQPPQRGKLQQGDREQGINPTFHFFYPDGHFTPVRAPGQEPRLGQIVSTAALATLPWTLRIRYCILSPGKVFDLDHEPVRAGIIPRATPGRLRPWQRVCSCAERRSGISRGKATGDADHADRQGTRGDLRPGS
jgi:hypothetical protein